MPCPRATRSCLIYHLKSESHTWATLACRQTWSSSLTHLTGGTWPAIQPHRFSEPWLPSPRSGPSLLPRCCTWPRPASGSASMVCVQSFFPHDSLFGSVRHTVSSPWFHTNLAPSSKDLPFLILHFHQVGSLMQSPIPFA